MDELMLNFGILPSLSLKIQYKVIGSCQPSAGIAPNAVSITEAIINPNARELSTNFVIHMFFFTCTIECLLRESIPDLSPPVLP